jgi:hypothetical protein
MGGFHDELRLSTWFNKRFFLTSVMVEPDYPALAIVLFRDAITDGAGSTINSNSRFPDVRASLEGVWSSRCGPEPGGSAATACSAMAPASTDWHASNVMC